MKRIPANGHQKGGIILTAPQARVTRVSDFQVVNFFDSQAIRPDGQIGSEVILIYALGEDGVIREFANGKWTAFPVPHGP